MTIRSLIIISLASFLLSESQAQNSDRPPAVSSSKPNVLMISIDDLNDWTGFLDGHPQALTPNMDKLAKQGRVFANAHCAVPVCSSSRASVMSGVAATRSSYEIGPARTTAWLMYPFSDTLKTTATLWQEAKCCITVSASIGGRHRSLVQPI